MPKENGAISQSDLSDESVQKIRRDESWSGGCNQRQPLTSHSGRSDRPVRL